MALSKKQTKMFSFNIFIGDRKVCNETTPQDKEQLLTTTEMGQMADAFDAHFQHSKLLWDILPFFVGNFQSNEPLDLCCSLHLCRHIAVWLLESFHNIFLPPTPFHHSTDFLLF